MRHKLDILTTTQNAALRTVTRCHSITQEDLLHEETSILQFKPHTEILSKQLALKCYHPQHLNHLTQVNPQPRQIRCTSITKYRGVVNGLPPPETPANLNRGIKGIHTHTVNETTQQYNANRVLVTRPLSLKSARQHFPEQLVLPSPNYSLDGARSLELSKQNRHLWRLRRLHIHAYPLWFLTCCTKRKVFCAVFPSLFIFVLCRNFFCSDRSEKKNKNLFLKQMVSTRKYRR